MTVQTTQRTLEGLGLPGTPIGDVIDNETRVAEVAMRPGDIAFRGSNAASGGQGCKKVTATASADPDGFMTASVLISTTSDQTFVASQFDGALGTSGVLNPARNVVLVLANDADWDATTAIVTGENTDGDIVTESLAIPNGGSATVTGVQVFSKIRSLFIPAQSGTATGTFGTGSVIGEFSGTQCIGIVQINPNHMPSSASAEFAQYDLVTIIKKGAVRVEVEAAVTDGGAVYVRQHADGSEVVGAIRGDADGTDAIAVEGMRFRGNSDSRDGVITAVIEVNYPAA
jgi:hypothetical protein